MTPWYDKVDIEGTSRTPNDYLKEFYETQTNAHIANVLSKALNADISSNAVRKRGRRMGLRKSQNVTESVTNQDFDNVTVTDDGNTKTVTANVKTKLINSLEELLAFCEVDLSEWEIVRQKIGAWQMGAKTEQKNLTYESGVVSGFVKSDGIEKEQLVKIEIVLERKRRIATLPDIAPILCTSTFPKNPNIKTGVRQGIKRALQWADPHFGYMRKGCRMLPLHHRETIDIIEQVLTLEDFEEIHLLGDIFDFASYSTHFANGPEFANTTQAALLEAHWVLQRQRMLQPDARMVAIQGNHDKRPEDAIAQYIAESYQLRAIKDFELPYSTYSVANLIDLDGLGIEWIENYPNGEDWLGNIRLSHGTVLGSKPGDTVKKLMLSEDSEIQGHGHRMECAIVTKNFNRRSKVQLSAMTGCACYTDGRIPGHNPHLQQWQNGFSIVEYTDDTVFNFTLVPVVNNKCVYGGVLYQGKDYIDELKKDVPWNF